MVALVSLVGPSAAGKSTLARALVQQTGVRVVTLVRARDQSARRLHSLTSPACVLHAATGRLLPPAGALPK
eukprot:3711378-Prymnesium_polylepis.1